MPGNTVSATPSAREIWMNRPLITDEPDTMHIVECIKSWFSD